MGFSESSRFVMDTNPPMVSVIAPCRNEAAFIEKSIKTILENDYPTEFIELLVVDGMSTDGTRDIVKKLAEQDNRIRLLDNPSKIVSSGMNIGIKAAHGEYITRIDCHSVFAHDYISKCVEVCQRTGAENVGGYIETLPGADTLTAKAIAAATSSRFGVGDSAFRIGGPEQEVDTVPFGTFKTKVFERIGLYDERLVRNQDIELNSRIRKSGGKIVISPEIKLSYYNRSTFIGLWQQAFNNGLWNPYTVWLVGSGLSLRHFIPMFFVLSFILLGAGSVLFRPICILLAGEVSLYFLLATVFARRTAEESGVSALRVFWAYLILHCAYGLGSLWSVITIPFKFPKRHKRIVSKPLAGRKP